MPYTYKSLAVVWAVLAVLFGFGGAGVFSGPWRLLLVFGALVTPALLRAPVFKSPVAIRSEQTARVTVARIPVIPR